MKSVSRSVWILSTVVGLVCSAAEIQAAIIVDGTAPGYTLDGSFESGSDGDPVDWLGADNSSALATELSIENDMIYRDDATPSDGSQYTVVGTNVNNSADYGVYLDTGYDLVLGDTFDLGFWHGKHGGTGWGEGDDEEMRWRLFTTTTDADDGTIEDTLATGTVSVPNNTTLTEASLSGVGEVTSATAGERLFLAFTPETSSNDYFALDEVNLVVIPEPSSLALLALGATAWASRRRWRK